MDQLPLPVVLRDGNTLDHFLPDASPEACAAVRRLLAGDQSLVWLWGPPASGRTHLLEAAADQVMQDGGTVLFVAFAADALPGPAFLEGAAEGATLVCLDDIDRIAGDAAWEEALFHLFNGLRARGGRLLVSASSPPARSPLHLPDLKSRFSLALTVALPALTDDARLAILTFRAACRGLELPPETGHYLLARGSRRLDDLIALLRELDRAALVQQRRLTVPFVRQVIAQRQTLPHEQVTPCPDLTKVQH